MFPTNYNPLTPTHPQKKIPPKLSSFEPLAQSKHPSWMDPLPILRASVGTGAHEIGEGSPKLSPPDHDLAGDDG